MWETLLVDGTDVESLAVIADWSGVLSSGSVAADPVTVPGRRGAVYTPGELEPYTFDVPLIVTGADTGEVYEKLSGLSALLDSTRGPLTVGRRVTLGAAQTTQEARCAVVSGWSVQLVGTNSARVSVAFMNLDGCWYSSAAVNASASGTLAVPGDIPTPNAVITLASGASIALAGSSVSYSGTGTLVLDGLTWEASSGDPGGVSHSGAVHPLVFLPGDNAVTVSGTASVAVKGAWR